MEIAVIGFVLVVAATVWIVLHAVAAAGHLQDLRDDVTRVRADLLSGTDADGDLAAAQHDAKEANHDTHDPVWWLASWIPPVHTVRGLASVSDDLAQKSLPPIVKVGSTVEPYRLRVNRNTIALAPLQAAAPTLAAADTATAAARAKVASLPSGWFGPVTTARDKVLSQLTSLAGSVDDATRFARVGPAMLGADGPRRYFVGIQNNAESRGTGGLVGGFAIVTANHGTIRVVQHGSNQLLRDADQPVADLGPEYNALYGAYDTTQVWSQSNIDPDFPQVARIWAGLWQTQSGEHIDGAIAVDPPALAALLGVVGDVTVKDYPTAFSSSTLTQFVEATEYRVFTNADPGPRKNFLSEVGTAVIHLLLSGAGTASDITTVLGQQAGQSHLAIWSARGDEESAITGTPLAGAIPQTSAPYASFDVDNVGAGKLDYYLQRSLTYTPGRCSAGRRAATVDIALHNTAPSRGLPTYVLIRGDLKKGIEKVSNEPLDVFVRATAGAELTDAQIDGRNIRVTSQIYLGHPVYGFETVVAPGATSHIRLTWSEPATSGAPVTKVQPLAQSQVTTLTPPSCA